MAPWLPRRHVRKEDIVTYGGGGHQRDAVPRLGERRSSTVGTPSVRSPGATEEESKDFTVWKQGQRHSQIWEEERKDKKRRCGHDERSEQRAEIGEIEVPEA